MLAAAVTRLAAFGWRAVDRIRPRRRPVVVVDSDRWLRTIVASAAVVVRPGDPRSRRAVAVLVGPGARRRAVGGRRRAPAFSYRADQPGIGTELDPAPFVAVDAVVRSRRVDDAPPDVRDRAADARRPAPAVPTSGDPGAVDRYVAAVRDVHVRYRDAYRRTSRDTVAAMTAPDPAAVTVLCVTNRPHLLENVIANFRRQVGCDAELLVVAHGEHCSDAVRRALSGVEGVRHIAVGEESTLGAGLNAGIAQCRTRFVAKFDDDDYYGPRYLVDALISAQASGAAVVGKHSYFVHLAGSDRGLLRFPGRECRATTYLAGGTLLLDVGRLGSVRFPDLTVGEDQGLLRRCILSGRGVYAGDMFNYVQHRGADNTWVVDESYLRRGALDAGPGDPIPIATV